MKYEKATVTIINMGDQDILTCSGEISKTYTPMNWGKIYTPPKQKQKASFGGWGWGWFGGWFHW